jgi:hypothetical protein
MPGVTNRIYSYFYQMSKYRWSICEPDNPAVIEKGMIQKEDIVQTFIEFPWIDRLRKIAAMKDDDVCFSPSLEFENKDAKQGVTFSIVGDENKNEFYFFYKRPKTVSSFFGLSKKNVEGYISDKTGFTKEDAVNILREFINDNFDCLELQVK